MWKSYRMGWVVHTVVRSVRTAKRIYKRKWSFLVLAALIFAGLTYLLARLDLLPQTPAPTVQSAPEVSLSSQTVPTPPVEQPELPVKVTIPAISLSAPINNPDTTDIPTLDKLLLSGAVRYPTSALLGQAGNVILFGHSSYLPVVLNQAYKTFDGIQKLKSGDSIEVDSADRAYVYAVRSVTRESAEDAVIPLSVPGRVLTLSTCDSFGSKTDRFVVVADFVESHAIPG